jgi:hypothetical protein
MHADADADFQNSVCDLNTLSGWDPDAPYNPQLITPRERRRLKPCYPAQTVSYAHITLSRVLRCEV